MAINYAGLLDQAQGLYGGIMGGYQSALAQQQAAQQATMGGYNKLQDTVLGGLAGQGKAQSQALADMYTARHGQEMQNLTSRGLGNSTVTSAVGRGLTLDEGKAQNSLAEQVARMNAQYQTQIGLAGLGYQGSAAAQNAALLQQQLGYQAGWQGNLLGASMRGLEQEQQRKDDMWNRIMGMGGASFGPPAYKGSGTGSRYGRAGGGGGGYEDPMVDNPFFGLSGLFGAGTQYSGRNGDTIQLNSANAMWPPSWAPTGDDLAGMFGGQGEVVDTAGYYGGNVDFGGGTFGGEVGAFDAGAEELFEE